MSYTCDRCGKEFEQPKMVDSGGEYGGIAHTYPASSCCESDFEETETINIVSEERMKLRIEYSRETDLIFSDNIPAYADWLENKLALRLPPVIKSVCYKDCGNTQPSGGSDNICLNCGSSIKQTVL